MTDPARSSGRPPDPLVEAASRGHNLLVPKPAAVPSLASAAGMIVSARRRRPTLGPTPSRLFARRMGECPNPSSTN
jgi:hypothetical protein